MLIKIPIPEPSANIKRQPPKAIDNASTSKPEEPRKVPKSTPINGTEHVITKPSPAVTEEKTPLQIPTNDDMSHHQQNPKHLPKTS